MAYTTINKPNSYFNTLLYTGNGSARTITGVGFQPDWVWVKDRTSANYHYLYDVLRGNNLNLFSNDTSAEVNVTTGQNGGGIGSQASDGFTIVAGNVNTNNVNTNGNLYASWNWKANGAGVSNTQGTISSTVSANTTSGFSIVSYTGNGTGGATVGHGLGAVPKMIIIKNRDDTDSWEIYHASLGATKYMQFTTAAAATNINRWNDTAPTSSVFSLGTEAGVNQSTEDFIAYCFADVKGYSKFGSYTGNGSTDGPFVYTGFSPAFLVIKQSNASGENWYMWDNKRATYNVADNRLYPNLSNAEETGTLLFDFLSNGFKLRATYTGFNASGGTFIYMAFASNPFVSSTQVPTTAR